MFVYVISAGERRHKIGIAACPEKRLRDLQTGSCDKLELVCAFDVEDARAVERTTHALLSDHKIQGEWFDLTSAGAITMIGATIANTAVCDSEWAAFGGWSHAVGDVVECRFSGAPWIVGPLPEAGRFYTVSAVYDEGAVDVVGVPNEDIAFCASQFWPAKHYRAA